MLASMERHWNDLHQPPKCISNEQIGDMTVKSSVVAWTPPIARREVCFDTCDHMLIFSTLSL